MGRETLRGWVWGERDKMFCECCIQYGNHVGVLCITLKLELVPFYISITPLSTGLSNWGNYLLTLRVCTMCIMETSMGDYTANCLGYRLFNG